MEKNKDRRRASVVNTADRIRLHKARRVTNCAHILIKLLLFGTLLSLMARPGSGIDCGTTANRETCVVMTLLSAASMFISNE